MNNPKTTRQLYIGDNLAVMRGLEENSVDLIYLDPPFNSKQMHEGNLDEEMGEQSFKDIWTMSDINDDDLWHLRNACPQAFNLINTLYDSHGESWKAYLTFMAVRLDEMRRLMKPTGSIYLHCDSHMNAPLRILMDIMFGENNMRGEITWQRSTSSQRGSQHESKTWGANTDTILCYAKSEKSRLNPLRKLTPAEIRKKFDKVNEKTGGKYYDDSSHIWRTPGMGARPNLCYEWRGFTNPGTAGWRMTKERLEEEYQKGNIVIKKNGKLERRKYLKDYAGYNFGRAWTDISNAGVDEHVGWKTQKPLALLERIINASSNKGDVVLDPFCGCATACVVAERLGRQWIGIDQHSAAAKIMEKRVKNDTKLLPVWGEVKIVDAHKAHNLPRRQKVNEIDKKDPRIKQGFYNRQGGQCGADKWCLSGGDVNILLMHYDRIIPAARGGYYTPDNVQLLCAACNTAKGKKTWSQFIKERRAQKAQKILDDSDVPRR